MLQAWNVRSGWGPETKTSEQGGQRTGQATRRTFWCDHGEKEIFVFVYKPYFPLDFFALLYQSSAFVFYPGLITIVFWIKNDRGRVIKCRTPGGVSGVQCLGLRLVSGVYLHFADSVPLLGKPFGGFSFSTLVMHELSLSQSATEKSSTAKSSVNRLLLVASSLSVPITGSLLHIR